MIRDWYAEARIVENDAVQWRRRFHRHPEIAFNEHRTSAFVEQTLRDLGFSPRRIGGTGIAATLEGGAGPGPCIGLRSDMDALPGDEMTGLDFASEVAGVMHSCGHDMHTAILLGAASILGRCRRDLPGRIKFFFQPAEEVFGGAKLFVEAGELDDVDGLAALHVMTGLETGSIALRRGTALAASDMFSITVTGRSCHGAQPSRGTDAVLAACHIVTTLQSVVSRSVSPLDAVVLSIGMINGGVAPNVITSEVVLRGTLRCLDDAVRENVVGRMAAIAERVASGLGAEARLTFEPGTPVLYCDDAWVDRMARVAGNLLSHDNVHFLDEPSLGGEDFAFMLQKAPGVFWRLGARAKGATKTDSHSATFVADEGAIVHGMALTCALATDALMEQGS